MTSSRRRIRTDVDGSGNDRDPAMIRDVRYWAGALESSGADARRGEPVEAG